MKTLEERLAARLKELRGEESQRSYAKKLGISHVALNQMEQGQENVTLRTLGILCRALRCDIADLFPPPEK
ncbi:MAG: hypothetical protein ETSY1_41155 [Candidatus Entotheonella factor]|uniref:HTH cro/C1-type domain-containing protein n=1 Tax=Entotheonella factor TaxID=1429438 RepID=W4L535_ENTF1|nr:MAG: hypothetical protein ETSY1_41155 [Candidatus Entotheonella factor]